MNRKEALESVKENVTNRNLVKHMMAVEAVMRALARRLGENEEEWGLAGLLHDIDIELTAGDASAHSRLGADLVREMGASDAMTEAVLCHNPAHGIPCKTRLAKALYCADPLTGLITAAVLVLPEKKLAKLEAGSVVRRYKEKGFAAGAKREQIAACSELGLELAEFADIGLKAMQSIAPELGL
jgi:uncharacterized protein